MSKTNGTAAAENTTKRFASFREIADFLRQNAERMRDAYKPNEYDKVNQADQILFDQFVAAAKFDDEVVQRAKAYPLDNFALAMKGKVEGLMVDRMDQNQEIVTRYLNDPQFQDLAFRLLVKRIYDEIRGGKREAVGG